jgi:hypothetical protein
LVHATVVADLGTVLAAAKLALLGETVVPVDSDLLIVDAAPVEKVNCFSSLLSIRVLDKTEATRLICLPIKPHKQVDDLPTLREQLHQLTLSREKTQISHVQRGRCAKFLLIRFLR